MEESIYGGGLTDGFSTRHEIDQTSALIKKLLKTYITHENDVKSFVHNDVTDQILMIVELMQGSKDRSEEIAELNSVASDSSH